MVWRPLQETFFPLNFLESSLGLSGKKKQKQKPEAQKPLGNDGKTSAFEVIRVKFEFWLKNLAEIPCYRHPQERMRNYNS